MRSIPNQHDPPRRELLWCQLDAPENNARPLIPFHRHFVNQRAQLLRYCPGMLPRKRSQLFLGRCDCPKGLFRTRLCCRLVIPVQDKVVIPRFPVRRHFVESGKNHSMVFGSCQDNVGRVSQLELLLEVVSGKLHLTNEGAGGETPHDIFVVEDMLSNLRPKSHQ